MFKSAEVDVESGKRNAQVVNETSKCGATAPRYLHVPRDGTGLRAWHWGSGADWKNNLGANETYMHAQG